MKTIPKAIAVILSLILTLSCFGSNAFAAEQSMKLYAICLSADGSAVEDEDNNETEYGDAVLLESDGKYLLMDTGAEYTSASLIEYLKKFGITELSVYISHLHSDHIGGLAAVTENFTINKLYLPDYKTIGTQFTNKDGFDIETVTRSVIKNRVGFDGLEDERVVYLKAGSSFSVGSVNAEVLGPVGSHSVSDYSGTSKAKNSHYLNDCSLTTIFNCGGVKFLTTGDIEAAEESALVNKYKSSGKLKASILKMPHHGLTTTSNTETFFSAVKAKYFFAENIGYGTTVSNGKTVWKNHSAIERAQEYGLAYMVGCENKPLIVDINSGKSSLYRDSISNAKAESGEKLTGWVSVCGIAQKPEGADASHPNYTGNNKYYIDENGNILTGVQKINGSSYFLGNGGAMEKGYYEYNKSSGKWIYKNARTYNGGKDLRDFEENGAMAVGFGNIVSNGKTYLCYHVPSTGFRKLGSKNWDIYDISGKKYAINASGVVFNNEGKGGLKTYTVNGKTRYRHFAADGAMTTGFKTLSGATYYFNPSDGFRATGLKCINSKYYYFNEYGKLQKNKTIKISGVNCKFNKDGVLVSPNPAKPKKLTVKAKSKGKNVISWEKVKGASGYIVYRATSKNGKYSAIKTLTKSSAKSYTDSKAKSKKKYYYKVAAYKKVGSAKIAGAMTSPKSVKTK